MRSFIAVGVLLVSAVAYAQSPQLQRGDSVRVLPGASPTDTRATPLVLTVVGVPNDRLRITAAQLLVNEVAVTGFSAEFLARVANSPERVPQVVPAGHYFVMGEQRSSAGDHSEYWGQHSGVRLQLARR